jgi:hypothetical protein
MLGNRNVIEPSPYTLLLESDEWVNKRNKIVNRDNNRCSKCFNLSFINEIELNARLARCFITKKGVFFNFKDIQSSDLITRMYNASIEDIIHDNLYFILTTHQNQIIAVFKLIINEIASSFIDYLNKSSELVTNKMEFELTEIFRKFYSTEAKQISWIHTKYLNVHHTFYQKGKNPWEYEDQHLITLCQPCHFKVHEEETIYLHDERGGKIELIICNRCGGTGNLPHYHYVDKGICFKCLGNRFVQKLL